MNAQLDFSLNRGFRFRRRFRFFKERRLKKEGFRHVSIIALKCRFSILDRLLRASLAEPGAGFHRTRRRRAGSVGRRAIGQRAARRERQARTAVAASEKVRAGQALAARKAEVCFAVSRYRAGK